MTITNTDSGTNVHEIASGIYRISTPVPEAVIGIPGGFTFNQYLVVDDEPLLFHTGPRGMFPLTKQAIESVIPLAKLRWISCSHVESDECGAMNELLAVAPNAVPLVGKLMAMVSMNDLANRTPRALEDNEEIVLGTHRVRWLSTPHLPHNWECGYLWEASTKTLLCGDIVTTAGIDGPPIAADDPLPAMIGMENAMHGFARTADTREQLEQLAKLEPKVLAAMHGTAFAGDGARVLRGLGASLVP